MTFELLEKTPQVTPLLVRLYDTHNLYSLAGNRGSEDACSELTTIMVDLLNIELSEKESELITDVLLALMKQAEVDLRAALADRLAAMNSVPLRMILNFANDDIRVADSVLRQSPVLEDMDLMYILQAKGVEYGRAMAHRKGLNAPIIDALANTEDFAIAVNLSNNNGVTLTRHAFEIFTRMAEVQPELAAPVMARTDLPRDIAEKMYAFVAHELKSQLVKRFGFDAVPAFSHVDDLTLEMISERTNADERQDNLLSYASHLKERGELKLSNIIAALRRGQYSTFLAQFSVFCALPIDTVRAMVRQPTGQGLATACRAMDIVKADYVSLYLLTERFRKHGRQMIGHAELSRIMTMFDDIDAGEARKILQNSRG